MQEMLGLSGVETVTTHMCRFGLMASDVWGPGLVKKPTKIMTNSAAIAEELDKQCEGGHHHVSHVRLLRGQAKGAAKYTNEFCTAICRGLQKEMREEPLQAVDDEEAVE